MEKMDNFNGGCFGSSCGGVIVKEKKKYLVIVFCLLIFVPIILIFTGTDVISKESKQIADSTKCKLCHVKLYFRWTKTAHYQQFKNLALTSEFNECETCHGSHEGKDNINGTSGMTIPKSFAETKQVCGQECHFGNEKAKSSTEIPVIEQKKWDSSNHGGKSSLACTQCHKLHKAKEEEKVDLKSNEFCLNCHGAGNAIAYSKEIKVHQVKKKCLSCHNPHTPRKKRLKPVQFNKRYKHYPVAKNNCFECHSTHRASSDKLTTRSKNNICYKCHTAKKYVFPNMGHAKAEGVADKGLCINCHNPHSSDQQFLLRKQLDKMCRSCHQKYKSHHFMRITVFRRKIPCNSCHNPHGGVYKAALRLKPKKLCQRCHE